MRRRNTLRTLVMMASLAAPIVTATFVGCNSADLVVAPACRPGFCTCEEDPQQATCKGFNDRPEGGKDPSDATPVETSVDDAAVAEAGDPDAADAADAEDAADLRD